MSDRINQPADIPAGFEPGPSGLVIPAGTAPMECERWRHEEGMALVRAQRIAAAHGLRLIVGCDDNRCAANPLISEQRLPSGNLVWTCQHKQRILTNGPKKKPPRGVFGRRG